MDEDLSHLHVERDLLQALHDTQSEHTTQLRELREGVEELREGQQKLREGQQKVLVGLELITGKLDGLIAEET